MTRYPPQVDETSVTRPQQPTTTPAVDLADWLAGLTDVERRGEGSVIAPANAMSITAATGAFFNGMPAASSSASASLAIRSAELMRSA